MAWDFITLVRRTYQGDDNWGDLYIKAIDNVRWEKLSYSYELPWNAYGYNEKKEKGKAKTPGTSKSDKSRIEIGYYELKPRSDGPKGWRIQLQSTKHRNYVQIHRAHKSMYIEGCILPVSFNNFTTSKMSKGDPIIQTQSVALMGKIQARYNLLRLKKENKGNPALIIAAVLPPKLMNAGVSVA